MRSSTTAARLATAAAAAVALSLLTMPAADAVTAAERQRALRTGVYVEGDSLTVGCAGTIRARLRNSVRTVGVDAEVGRFTSPGLSRLTSDRKARSARIWVVALGTNDGPDPGRIRSEVNRSLRLAGPDREVVWLTVRRPGGYERVNRVLRSMDRESDRLHLIDWARITARNGGLVAGDGVHATARGYRLRGRLIANTALYLARQP